MSERPVDQTEYSDDWIASAWGERGNDALLSPGPLRPRPRVARALALAAPQAGNRLLDIACGRAEVPAIVCQQGGYGVGLDYSAASIDFARQVKAVHDTGGDGGMDLTRADATRLPFADASFERVTLLDIIEHLHDEQLEAMFLEVRRVLKPQGYAVIHTLPNRWVYDISYPLLHRLCRRVPSDPRGPFEKKIHINEQDLPHLHRLLQGAGLRHRLWLEQQIPAQARWNAGQDRYDDTRDSVYPILARWPGRVLEGLSLSPLKLILSNDIFGILWKEELPDDAPRLPLALTERLVCGLGACRM